MDFRRFRYVTDDNEKRDTYLLMLTKYSELFENSNNLDECVAVGKNILRILEKL